MKKYLLSIAVLMMAAITFTACSDDDEPEGDDGFAKTTWVGQLIDEDGKQDITITFSDSSKGVQYVNGVVSEEDITIPMEVWVNFNYTVSGTQVTIKANKIIAKAMGVIVPDVEVEEEPIVLEYNKDKKTLTLSDDYQTVVLTKTKYKEIVVPTK